MSADMVENWDSRKTRLVAGVLLILVGLAGIGAGVAAFVMKANLVANTSSMDARLQLAFAPDQQAIIAQYAKYLDLGGPIGLGIGAVILLVGVILLATMPPQIVRS